MRIVFIGAVEFSRRTLLHLIERQENIVGVCSQPSQGPNADFAALDGLCAVHDIPLLLETDLSSEHALDWIGSKAPDVIFCFGWSRLLGDKLLNLAPLGVVGFHPAALPENRGRHPIIWALALGLDHTASTFFFMDAGADSGDILSQKAVAIAPLDDAGSLYTKIVDTALSQLDEFVPALRDRTYRRTPQDHSRANSWRKRKPAEGLIDWRMSAKTVVNLVRALAAPYVGASFRIGTEEFKVWEAVLVQDTGQNIEPGKVVLGGEAAVVKCGDGAVKLIRTEPAITLDTGQYL